jgi:hypothetical protein
LVGSEEAAAKHVLVKFDGGHRHSKHTAHPTQAGAESNRHRSGTEYSRQAPQAFRNQCAAVVVKEERRRSQARKNEEEWKHACRKKKGEKSDARSGEDGRGRTEDV